MVSRYQGIPKFFYIAEDEAGKEIRRPYVNEIHDAETDQGFLRVQVFARDVQQPIEKTLMRSDDPKVIPKPPGEGWEMDEKQSDPKKGRFVFNRPLDMTNSFVGFEKFRIDDVWPTTKKERKTRINKGDEEPDFSKE